MNQSWTLVNPFLTSPPTDRPATTRHSNSTSSRDLHPKILCYEKLQQLVSMYYLTEEDGMRWMYAKQDLLPGMTVFEEPPLMTVTNAEINKYMGRTKPKFERYLAVYDIFNKRLTAKQQFSFLSLFGPVYPHFEKSLRGVAKETFQDDGKTLLSEEETQLYMQVSCIERRNCMTFAKEDVTLQLASRMRHSCLPNCFLHYADGLCICRVVLPVKANEILTIEYKPGIQTINTAERRFHFIEFKEFTCHCPRCDADGDDTRQFECFDAACEGRHYTCQPISAKKHQFTETRYKGVEYVEPHLLPCTVCRRASPAEYQEQMFQLEARLPTIYQKTAAKQKKIHYNDPAAQRALLRELEQLQYPRWHSLGLSLGITELAERKDLYLQGAPEQRDKLQVLCGQLIQTVDSILRFPAPFVCDLLVVVSSGYQVLGLDQEARQTMLRALRLHLLLYGRKDETPKDLFVALQKLCIVSSGHATTAPAATGAAVEPPPLWTADRCAYCEESPARAALTLSLCGRCRQVAYCSKGCQKAHWKVHKGKCVKVSAAT